MKRKISIRPLVIGGALFVLVLAVYFISVMAPSVSASNAWQRSGGVMMTVDMDALSIMGLSQQDGWAEYVYTLQGIYLQTPATWNIDQDTWKQPFRLEIREPDDSARIYVYLTRVSKDLKNNEVPAAVIDGWQIHTDPQPTQITIKDHDWYMTDGVRKDSAQRCRLYWTETDYWAMAVLYIADYDRWGNVPIAEHVVDSIYIFKNFDNAGNYDIRYLPMILPVSNEDDLPPWNPLEALREGLKK